jgi:hypothetical protein
MIFLPLQLAAFHGLHYEMRDVIFHIQAKKAFWACLMRLSVIVLYTLIFQYWIGFMANEVFVGLCLSHVLWVLPAFIRYKFYIFYKSKARAIYALMMVCSVLYGVFAALLATGIYPPAVLGLLLPLVIRLMLNRFDEQNPVAIDYDTFPADMSHTWRKISRYDKYYEAKYGPLIADASKLYNLNPTMIKYLFILVHDHRGGWYYKLGEYILCYFFPKIAVRLDISVGIAQIKISLAQKYYNQPPRTFLRKLLTPQNQVDLCSRYFRDIYDEYLIEKNKYDDDVESLCYYLARRYTGAIITRDRKFVHIYATIFKSCDPLRYLK